MIKRDIHGMFPGASNDASEQYAIYSDSKTTS